LTKQFFTTAGINKSLQLPALAAQSNTVTVSGYSGGGTFTSLLSVVEPETIDGFASFNGILFDSWSVILGSSDLSLVDNAIAVATQRESEGVAGPMSALLNKPIYIFSGSEDFLA
jgi:hypothetical protein